MERAYFYLGGNALHTGIYTDLIRRLEEEDLVIGLVSRVRVSPNPRDLWRAWRDRHFIGPNRTEVVRAGIRGGLHRLPVWRMLPELSIPALTRALGLGTRSDRVVVVHTRQILMARLALALKRLNPSLRVIAELEGDDLAEVAYKRSKALRPGPRQRLLWSLEHRYYRQEERRILAESDAVICVSRRLRDVMVERFALPPDRVERIHVIPTLASRREFGFDAGRREATRLTLGLKGRFVVVYSGNLRGRWQVPEKLVEAFVAIRQVRANACFLVLTPEADRRPIARLLEGAGVAPGDALLFSCPHEQVVDHLCAGDVGLLLRERHPMNEVAAPGKFAEYVLSGLPLVMTEGIGDFSEAMRDSEYACVLPGLDDRADVRERVQRFCARDFAPEQRAEFARWAGERFGVRRVTPQLAQLYRTV